MYESLWLPVATSSNTSLQKFI